MPFLSKFLISGYYKNIILGDITIMENLSPESIQPAQEVKPKKKSWLKRILIVFLVFILLIVGSIAALPLYSSAFISFIVGPLTQITGRQVSLDDLSVSVFGSSLSLKNFQVKEENKKDDFFKVEKVLIDFDILPMMKGQFNLPTIEISGVYAKIIMDESGKPSYGTIQKKFESQAKPSTSEKPIKEAAPITSLPKVNAHIKLANINLTFEDRRENKTVQLKNFNWQLDVSGLDNITYKSNWEEFRIEDGLEKIFASLIYALEGQAKLAIENSKFVVQAKGQLNLTNMQAKQKEQTFLKDSKVSFIHDLAINLNQGTIDINKLAFTSDYANIDISDIKVQKLNEFQNLIEQMKAAKNREEIQSLVAKLPIDGWQGKFLIQASLDKLQQDFGNIIREKSQEKVLNFGGTIDLSGNWQGKANILSFQENCKISNLYATGKLPQEDGTFKNYRVGLDVGQKIDSSADLIQRQFNTNSECKITVPIANRSPLILLDHQQNSQLVNQQGFNKWGINSWKNSVTINFDAVQELLKDFLPKGTQVKGLFQTNNDIKTINQEINIVGQTNLNVSVNTAKYPNLPALQIIGNRNIIIALDSDQMPAKIQVKKFDLKSSNNKLISVEGNGDLNLKTFENPSLQLALAIQFKELQPYLEPFIEGLQIAGTFEHRLNAKEQDKKVILNNKGQLAGFMVNLPTLKGPIAPLRLNDLNWNSELTVGQHPTNKENGFVLYPSFTQVNQSKSPLLLCNYEASGFKQDKGMNLEKFQFSARLYGKTLQGILPVEIIKDPQLLELWTKNLNLDGYCDFNFNLQGKTPENIKFNSVTNLTNFIVKFQNKEMGTLLDKSNKMPLVLNFNADYQKNEAGEILSLPNNELQINQVKMPLGNLRIQDGKHITGQDGQAVQVFRIGPFKLEQLADMLPIIKQMQLETAILESRLDNFLVHTPEEQMQGKFVLKFIAPQMNLERMKQISGGGKVKEKIQENQPIRSRLQGEEPPLQQLTQKIRDTLKKIGLDVDISIQKVIIDQANQGEDIKMTLGFNNKEKPDNQMKFNLTGKLGQGNLDVKGFSDLDREHPEWKLNYNMDNVPYIVSIFGPFVNKFSEKIPFPILEKMQFRDQTEVKFSLKGSNNGYGIDPRGIKRSVVSGEDIVFELPSGKFDLGFDTSKFLNLEDMKKQIEEKLRPMEQAIAPLKSEESAVSTQISQLEEKIKAAQEKIAEIKKATGPILETIKKTELLAKWQPALGEKLKGLREQLGKYESQISDQEKQRTQFGDTIQKHKAKLQEIRDKIKAEENKIAQMREELQKKTQVSNPFQFQFDKIQIKLKVDNEKAWAGSGTLDTILPHPVSKVNYVEIVFQPAGRKFPKISGWCGLDGKYRFNFLPTEDILQQFGSLGPVASSFSEKIKDRGISWGNNGFEE